MINHFEIGGRIVRFIPNDYGGELELSVHPAKREPFIAKVKLFKEQAEAHAEELVPGTPVLIFGQVNAFQSQKTGDWWTNLNCNDLFFPARKEKIEPKAAPKPEPEEESEPIPF